MFMLWVALIYVAFNGSQQRDPSVSSFYFYKHFILLYVSESKEMLFQNFRSNFKIIPFIAVSHECKY